MMEPAASPAPAPVPQKPAVDPEVLDRILAQQATLLEAMQRQAEQHAALRDALNRQAEEMKALASKAMEAKPPEPTRKASPWPLVSALIALLTLGVVAYGFSSGARRSSSSADGEAELFKSNQETDAKGFADLRTEFASFRSEVKADLEAIRTDAKADVATLQAAMAALKPAAAPAPPARRKKR